MSEALQPPLPQPPNWGAYVAGKDTIAYAYGTEADTETQDDLLEQKVANPTQQNIFRAEVIANDGTNMPGVGTTTGAEFAGDTTQGGPNKVAGKANIPNSLPGGYTP